MFSHNQCPQKGLKWRSWAIFPLFIFSNGENKNPNQPSESATCVVKSVQPEHGSWPKMSSKRDFWQSLATSNSCSNCRLFERHHFLSNQDRLRQRCKPWLFVDVSIVACGCGDHCAASWTGRSSMQAKRREWSWYRGRLLTSHPLYLLFSIR